MELKLVTPPAIEPVSLAEARAHLRVDGTGEDALVQALLTAARECCESFLARALISQSWKLVFDAWPGSDRNTGGKGYNPFGSGGNAINMPLGLLAVTRIETFALDGSGTTFNATAYDVFPGRNGRIAPTTGQSWPRPGRPFGGIEISFDAGFGTLASDVPQALRTGILMLVAALFENRGDAPLEAAKTSGITALWRPYRKLAR